MKNKRLKIGAYSTAVSLVVIAIAVIINMIVAALPTKYTKFDTTGIGIYNLSEDTQKIVKDVDEDVTLFLVAQREKEDQTLLEFMNRYAQLNSKIKVKTVDPAVTPSFTSDNGTAHELSKMKENSVIAVGEKRDFEIARDSIYVVEYTEEDYYNYYYSGISPTGTQSFAGEQALTGAIDNITSDDLPKVYLLGGHGESDLGSSLSGYMKTDNYETASLNLMTGDGTVPNDADCIVINVPAADISSNELEALKSYVDCGGKLILITAFNQAKTDYTNLNALCSYYGMDPVEGLVMEGSQSNYYQNQYYLIPNIDTSNSITSEMGGYNILMPASAAFTVSDNLRDNVTVSKLLTTSSSAFTVSLNGNTIDTENHIYDGTCVLGAAATVSGTEEQVTGSFVWYTSAGITDDSIDSFVSGANSSLFLSTLSSLCEKKASVSIAAKSMDTENLVLSESAANVWSTLFTIIVPLVVIITGFGVWYSRRKR